MTTTACVAPTFPRPPRRASRRRVAAFLARHGWARAERRRLAGDASFRRYERIIAGDRRAVLMIAPPEKEDVRPFLAIARHLRARGFGTPEVLAADETAGLALLEDLGDRRYTRVLGEGGDEGAMYAAAVDVLIELHREPLAGLDVPPYDDSRLGEEADLLVDWFLPAASGVPTPAPARAAYRAAFNAVLPLVRAVPEVLVLRDYHADNLVWLPEHEGRRRVGLLDFQDAVVGPLAYDLVSLLEDARRDIAKATVEAMLARYLAGRGRDGLDRGAFAAAYAVLGAQRNCKIVGIFTRLWRRDGKPAYLDYLPRVWRHLEGDLAHPALAPVKRWLDDHVPPEWRRRPAT